MDLNLGGIIPQVTTPVLDTVSLLRTGTVDQIASFLRANPEQRGTVETALATSGRTGDLSSIVERAGATLTNVVSSAGQTVTQIGTQAGTAVTQTVGTVARTVETLGTMTRPVQAGAEQVLGRATAVVTEPLRAVTETAGRVAGALVETAGRVAVPAGEIAVRPALDPARALLSEAVRGARSPSELPASVTTGRIGVATDTIPGARGSDAITTAMREGRLAELIAAAMKEGRFDALLAEARASGRLADLAVAARSLDSVLAAFAAKGGLSVTELALLARSGLMSEADARALRAAGVPVDLDVEESTPLFAPRDGPAEERFEVEHANADGVPIGGLPDPALASFDAGAIRIGSRAAFDSYGLLGPPGSTVIAADAFEGLVREANGDLSLVERRLGLEGGVLRDPDTFIALVDRRDLAGLRLAGDHGAAGGWLPGGDRAGGLPSALADLGRATTFREVTLDGGRG